MDAPGFLKETPLHLASKNGFKDLVDILVQSGGNVNARNFPKQETPLHLAAQNGHPYIAEYLIQHGSKVNIRNVPLQDTPLHLASRNGHGQVVDILLQHGSDVDARNAPSQNTPLHLAAQNGHRQVADILLQGGSDVNARNFPRQESPLHLAARNGHQHIVEFLIQHGGKLNSRNVPWRETPLHAAAQNVHKQVADILVEQGSDVNARNFLSQETPLHLASKSGHQNIAEFLLQRGSKVNVQNVPGKEIPLHLAFRNGHRQVMDVIYQYESDARARSTPWQNMPQHHVAQNGHKQVADILVQNGSDVNARNSPRQEILLHLTAQNGQQHTAVFLLELGGKANSRNVPWPETPLHVAAQKVSIHTYPEVSIQQCSLLIAQNVPWQETHLHLAAQNEHREVADAFLHHSSDVSARSSIRQNASLYLASKHGHTQVADVLTQHGSNVSSRHEQNKHKHIAEVLNGNESHLNVEFMPPIHLAAQCRHQEMLCHFKGHPFSANNGNKQPVEVLTRHGSYANAKNMLELSSISLTRHNGHNKGEGTTKIQLKRKVIANGTEDQHHHLLKELEESSNSNFVPTKNRQARCRHFKAKMKHLMIQPLQDNFEVIYSCVFEIIGKKRIVWSPCSYVRIRLKKNSTQIFNSRKICQKGFCRASSKWCFMPFSTKRRSTRVETCLNCSELLTLPFMRNIGENWSFYGLICGNTERTMNVGLLIDNVLHVPPHVNSYNHCQPCLTPTMQLFTNTIIKLVVVIGALLPLCFVVMLLLWKRSFCRNKTSGMNSFNERVHVAPMRSTFKQCQQCDDPQTQLCEPLNEHLCLNDLPMGHACPEELRIERVRSWLTSNLEEELHIKGT